MRPVKKTPTDQLLSLISDHMSVPGHLPHPTTEGDFVMSAIRAAQIAAPTTRQKILGDICNVLDCEPDALSFLFEEFQMPQTNIATYEVMVPDFQTQLYAAAE